MDIYLYIYLILAALAFVEICVKGYGYKYLILGLVFLIIWLVVGLRLETGNDWLPYLNYYEQTADNNFEIGYGLVVSLFRDIGLNYAEFLFIYTFAYLIIFAYAFRKFKYPAFALLLFYGSYLLGLMGTARQVMAVSICFLALNKVSEKSYKSFFALVVLASLIHMSAIIFLVTYLFRDIKLTITVALKYSLAAIVFSIFSVKAVNILYDIIPDSTFVHQQLMDYIVTDDRLPIYYRENVLEKVFIYIKRFFLVALFAYIRKYITKLPELYDLVLTCYFFSLVLFILFYQVLPTLAIRLSLYFYVFDVALSALIVNCFTGGRRVLIALFLVAISFQKYFITLYRDEDMLIPYKSVFINQYVVKQ